MDDATLPALGRSPLAPAAPNELSATSRLTGADVPFLQLVRALSLKRTGSASVTDPAVHGRLELVHAEFRQACASILEKHLGLNDAIAALRGLESAPVQRYLAARHAMGPALRTALVQLEQRMGSIEI